MEALYSIEALATGGGRNGHVTSTTGRIDTDLSIPKEMGGPGENLPNPEEFFASGYAACFHSALQSVARVRKVELGESSVGCRVKFIVLGEGRYTLAVDLEVAISNLEHDAAMEMVELAHQACPYSNATRGNIEVNLSLVED